MGCDIHPGVYTRYESGFDWYELRAVPKSSRNYGLFSFIAGVRSGYAFDFGTYSEMRGLPERFSLEDGDGALTGDHSPSHYTLPDFRKMMKAAKTGDNTDSREQLDHWLRVMEFVATEYGVEEKNIYFIFNFDS